MVLCVEASGNLPSIFGAAPLGAIRRKSAYVLVLPMLVLFAGCREEASPALLFEKSVVDLGIVRDGTTVRHEFHFTTADDNDKIVISDLETSCQCMAVSSKNIGEALHPGEKGVITVEIDVDDLGGSFSGTINVLTLPKSSMPLVLRLHGVAVGYPKVDGPQPVIVSTLIGQPITVDVNVVAQRPHGDQRFVPDFDQSTLRGFEIENYGYREALLHPAGAQVSPGTRELHTVRLTHTPCMETVHTQELLEIAWKGVSQRTVCLVRIDAIHPLSLSVPEPFLGLVSPGALVETTYSFACDGHVWQKKVEFELVSDGDGIARLSPDGSGVRVMLTAPLTAGRFSRVWQARIPDENIPPLRLQVTGIVVDASKEIP